MCSCCIFSVIYSLLHVLCYIFFVILPSPFIHIGIVLDLVPGVILNLQDTLQDPEMQQIAQYLSLLTAVTNTKPGVQTLEEAKGTNPSTSTSASSSPLSSKKQTNTCLRLRVRINTVHVVLRAVHPLFDGLDTFTSPVLVLALRETGITGIMTTTVTPATAKEKEEKTGGGVDRVSQNSSFSLNVHGLGVNFHSDGSFLHQDMVLQTSNEDSRSSTSFANQNKPVKILDPTPMNFSFWQKIRNVHASSLGEQQASSGVTSQLGSLIVSISPVEVTYLIVLSQAYTNRTNPTTNVNATGTSGNMLIENEEEEEETEGRPDHVLLLLDVINEHCDTMLHEIRRNARQQAEQMAEQREEAQVQEEVNLSLRQSSFFVRHQTVENMTMIEINDEISRNGPLLASASLLGLSLHIGIDQFLFTLLVAPKGVSVSRPCIRATLSNVRLDGSHALQSGGSSDSSGVSAGPCFEAQGGLQLCVQHYNAYHSYWQPMLEAMSYTLTLKVPLLSFTREDLLQTKIAIQTQDLLQINVTQPLLQDLIGMGQYQENLDRDGDGTLDVSDILLNESANFLPYMIINDTGVDLTFWFPGDDIVKRSEKMTVNKNATYRFDIPEDRKQLAAQSMTNADTTTVLQHEVHVKFDNNTKRLSSLPIDVTGYHVQRLKPLSNNSSSISNSNTLPTHLDWHVSLEGGVRVIRVQSLLSVENWTTEIMEVKVDQLEQLNYEALQTYYQKKECSLSLEQLNSKGYYQEEEEEKNKKTTDHTDHTEETETKAKTKKEEVYGIYSLLPGEIFHVPLSAAPRCILHVRPKAEDQMDGSPALEEDQVQWCYITNLYSHTKDSHTLYENDQQSQQMGIHLDPHWKSSEATEEADYILCCDTNNDDEDEIEEETEEKKLSAMRVGCLFVLHVHKDPIYNKVGQCSYQLYPLMTIQNLLTKSIIMTLHDDTTTDTSLDQYTQTTLQPGEVRTIMSTKYNYNDLAGSSRGSASRSRSSSRLKEGLGLSGGNDDHHWHPAKRRSAFTHWSYCMNGFQNSDPIPLFREKRVPSLVDAPSQIQIQDDNSRVQVRKNNNNTPANQTPC